MSNNSNNNFSGLSAFALIAIFAMLAFGVIFFCQGYIYLAEEVLEWDQRSTYTVGLSILLLLYALLFARTIATKPKNKENLDAESSEYEKTKERSRPVSILGLSAVMIFLLGCIVFKNKDVWNVPGFVGLTLVASSCIFLIAADFFQYKITKNKLYLFLIPIWVVVFFVFVSRIFNGTENIL